MSNNNEDTNGEQVENMLLVGGEASMPDDRTEAVKLIIEAIEESPYEVGDTVHFRGQTNHVGAMKMFVNAYNKKFDDELDVQKHDVDWPDDDDPVRNDEEEWNKRVSDLFDERNEQMMDHIDAVVIVANGDENDYLEDITSMASQLDTYDHSLSISEEEAEEVFNAV